MKSKRKISKISIKKRVFIQGGSIPVCSPYWGMVVLCKSDVTHFFYGKEKCKMCWPEGTSFLLIKGETRVIN